MANYGAVMLMLLALAVAGKCSGENNSSEQEGQRTVYDIELIPALIAISNALGNLQIKVESSEKLQRNDTALLREYLENQKKTSDSVFDLIKIPDIVSTLSVQLREQSQVVNLLMTELEKSRNVKDLEKQLGEAKGKMEELSSEKKLLKNTVRELQESLQAARKRSTTKVEPTNEVGPETCSLPNRNEIRTQVLQFNKTKDWKTLKRNLGELLENTGAAYEQLKRIDTTDDMPLRTLGFRGYVELAKVLVTCVGATNILDRDGGTIIHGSVRNGNMELLEWLVDHGVDIDENDNNLYPPLVYAAMAGHLWVVKYLVQAGANVDAKTIFNETALDRVKQYDHRDVEKYLLQFSN